MNRSRCDFEAGRFRLSPVDLGIDDRAIIGKYSNAVFFNDLKCWKGRQLLKLSIAAGIVNNFIEGVKKCH